MRLRTKGFWILVAVATCVLGVSAAPGPVPADGPWLQYAEPGLGGFDADKLEAARHKADALGSGAIVVVRGGLVVAAWGDIERKFKCHSVRKSFLSALYGSAVADGTIDLETTLAELGIDDVQPLTDHEKRATVEHLIQARSGVYHPAAKEPRDMKQGRPARGTAGPGESFWYNNWDFNTAGHVFELATGEGVLDAFTEKLAEPLGMEDFRRGDAMYQFERSSSRVPAYAFRLSARDAARFGLLYLRDGKWHDRQLIPADWIDRSWTRHSDLRDGQGYGYMWWIFEPGSNPAHPELAGYAARGTGGQLIFVMPGLDLVVVHRADTDFARGVGGSDVWDVVGDIVGAIKGDARRSKRLKALSPQPFSRTLPALEFPEVVTLAPEILDRYVGRYTVGDQAVIDVSRIDGVLVGRMSGQGETDFFPISETEFWSPASGARVRYEMDEKGNVARGIVRFRGQKMVAVPMANAAATR